MMVGRDVKLVPDKEPVQAGEPRLVVQDLYVGGDRGRERRGRSQFGDPPG